MLLQRPALSLLEWTTRSMRHQHQPPLPIFCSNSKRISNKPFELDLKVQISMLTGLFFLHPPFLAGWWLAFKWKSQSPLSQLKSSSRGDIGLVAEECRGGENKRGNRGDRKKEPLMTTHVLCPIWLEKEKRAGRPQKPVQS